MMQALSILAILAAIALPLLDYFLLRPRRRALAGADLGSRLTGAERFIYLAFLVALGGMVLSSILMLAFGGRMQRWMLVLHMSLAPLFAIAVTALAVLWAEANVLARTRVGERIAFWLVALFALVTIVTAMLSMMPWFGSIGQELLLDVHRVSSMLLLVAAAYQAVRLLARAAPKTTRTPAPQA